MLKQITLREWINRFNKGDYNSTNIETQCEAGWSDWFCRENELRDKLYKMAEIVKEIKNEFILDNYYVWFTNTNVGCDSSYDTFRFDPLKREMRNKMHFGVQCDHPCGDGSEYVIYTARSGYKDELKCDCEEEVLADIEQFAGEIESKISI